MPKHPTTEAYISGRDVVTRVKDVEGDFPGLDILRGTIVFDMSRALPRRIECEDIGRDGSLWPLHFEPRHSETKLALFISGEEMEKLVEAIIKALIPPERFTEAAAIEEQLLGELREKLRRAREGA